jgi:hypothetical protein
LITNGEFGKIDKFEITKLADALVTETELVVVFPVRRRDVGSGKGGSLLHVTRA